MIYRFTLLSDEVDNFIREIQIDPEATFYDLHKAIIDCVGYKDDAPTSFFTCDDGWEKETEITLEPMDDNPEVDSYVMRETPLSDLVEDEHQRLIYVFDYMTERCFFLELSEIITGQTILTPRCTRKKGTPPRQTVDFEQFAAQATSLDLATDFYGDQDYDPSELDPEGFDGLDQGIASNPYDDELY